MSLDTTVRSDIYFLLATIRLIMMLEAEQDLV